LAAKTTRLQATQDCWQCHTNRLHLPLLLPAASANCNDVTKLCGAAGCGARLVTKAFAKAKGGFKSACCVDGRLATTTPTGAPGWAGKQVQFHKTNTGTLWRQQRKWDYIDVPTWPTKQQSITCCNTDICAGVTCEPPGECQSAAAVCDPATGLCGAAPNKTDGTPCSLDFCQDGACIGESTILFEWHGGENTMCRDNCLSALPPWRSKCRRCDPASDSGARTNSRGKKARRGNWAHNIRQCQGCYGPPKYVHCRCHCECWREHRPTYVVCQAAENKKLAGLSQGTSPVWWSAWNAKDISGAKDQNPSCGSCWAFATTSCLESAVMSFYKGFGQGERDAVR
jgi:hypothetical protein